MVERIRQPLGQLPGLLGAHRGRDDRTGDLGEVGQGGALVGAPLVRGVAVHVQGADRRAEQVDRRALHGTDGAVGEPVRQGRPPLVGPDVVARCRRVVDEAGDARPLAGGELGLLQLLAPRAGGHRVAQRAVLVHQHHPAAADLEQLRTGLDDLLQGRLQHGPVGLVAEPPQARRQRLGVDRRVHHHPSRRDRNSRVAPDHCGHGELHSSCCCRASYGAVVRPVNAPSRSAVSRRPGCGAARPASA